MGVGKDADEADIKKQYKKQALKWHPDRHANKPEEQQKEAAKQAAAAQKAEEAKHMSDEGIKALMATAAKGKLTMLGKTQLLSKPPNVFEEV